MTCSGRTARGWRHGVGLWLLLLAAGCGSDKGSGPDLEPFDRGELDLIFAAPTDAERAAILAEWAARDVGAHDVQVELRDTVTVGIDTVEVRILSHAVDGERHFGAVVVPVDAPAAPVLLYTHFSARGLNVESALFALGAVAGVRAGRVALVLPSYRGKILSYGTREWVSQGRISLWDGEVDDALALLAVAWSQPGVRRAGTAALGFSAGGAIALLAAAREPGIEAVVDFFAPVDFFSPWSRGLFERVLDDAGPGIDSIPQLDSDLVTPLEAGDLGVDAFRRELLKRSVLHFAERLPPVLAHHGTADDIVAVSETQALAARLVDTGGSVQAWYYAGGGHSPFGLGGSLARTAQFLDRLWASTAPTQAGRSLASRSSWSAAGSVIGAHPAKGWSPPMQ